MYVDRAFKLLETLDVRVHRVVPILKFLHVVHEVRHDGFHITRGMETQYVFRFLDADLVVTKILDVLDVEINLDSQSLFNG